MTTQPLAEYAPAPKVEKTSTLSAQGEQSRTNLWALWGFIIMLVGVAVAVIAKKLMHDEFVAVVGILVSLAGMFLVAYPHLSPARRKKYDSDPSSKPEMPAPSLPKYLPQGSNIDYLPSITERTTDLLKTSTAARQKDDRESQA
jgi:hypothetical protein